MILVALAGLCVLTVPLSGGRLRRLAHLRLRGLWLPVVALALEVMTAVTGAAPSAHPAVHVVTYALAGLFLWCNRRLPGAGVIGLGAALNALAIVPIVIPRRVPLPAVLGIGDCVLFAGTLLLLHRTCGRGVPEPITLKPIPDAGGAIPPLVLRPR